jgi:hypothetical protein
MSRRPTFSVVQLCCGIIHRFWFGENETQGDPFCARFGEPLQVAGLCFGDYYGPVPQVPELASVRRLPSLYADPSFSLPHVASASISSLPSEILRARFIRRLLSCLLPLLHAYSLSPPTVARTHARTRARSRRDD